ncbi:hypothetical protein GGTG_01889 [Gaeumannomyces tritici R3-111a-1]|uniref:Uncharacterized protein n=1 Tax=Gaeumannomyces tritici (strain R3-111a-1) TaxID=644352 RepID=J3NKU8_GAET3|nr:hypothetical protein GGTG_01889 [Gaeumannomyces tritici R3-111a-1]EJT81915.1 hypothetical protein GGTG_01889 [Gaeumannomyces tritici R3-111a-1]
MMRLCSLGLALLGAGLIATAQAESFLFTEPNSNIPIQDKLYRTDSRGLEFKYSYTRQNPSRVGHAKKVTITIHRGEPTVPLAQVSLVYPDVKYNGPIFSPMQGRPPMSGTEFSGPILSEPPDGLPVDGIYRMKLKELSWDPEARNVSGTVTIIDAAKLATSLSRSIEQTPPELFFDLSLEVPSTNSPELDTTGKIKTRQNSNAARFGLANEALSQNNDAFEKQQGLFFSNGGGGGTGVDPSKPTTSATTGGALPNGTASLSADSGISTGAIAGIAVGAVLGALLIGTALVWFFVRRRRQNKAGKAGLGYNGGSTRSGDLVAEKEANAIVAESPRSPYSEDRTHRDSTLAAGAGETAGDYQPYSDNPTATANAPPPVIAAPVARAASANSRSTADRSSAAFPASAPPPAIGEDGLPPRSDTGMSGRYAHLIEDNMTADEIARLEEEERQLDVAIEQARGVTTK